MKEKLRLLLMNQKKPYIRDIDIIIALKLSDDARYSLIKRAKKEAWLTPLKKGLYLIEKPYRKQEPNLFEIAQFLYGPSHISLESALSYHQWIPEAVYTTTSVTPLRTNEFKTSLTLFSFSHVPIDYFYSGTNRVESTDEVFFISSPWRALADLIYVQRKHWECLDDISLDLRIEPEVLYESDIQTLEELANHYPSVRVRKQLKAYLEEVNNARKQNY